MPPIQVILTSLNEQDEFPERRIILPPYSRIPIGRSSKNATKRLLATPFNAFIDSPVISREHAILTASTALGVPKVLVIDQGSMHGTKVNSNFVRPHREHQLNNGDVVQFGVDVIRDQETFIAKRYRFSSRFPPPHELEPAFPQGINVPDSVSDEEDIDGGEAFLPPSPRAPNYGSQSNPVNVDDFDKNIPREVIDLDYDEDDEDDHFATQAAIIKPAVGSPHVDKEMRSSPIPDCGKNTGVATGASLSAFQLAFADDNHLSDEEEPMDDNDDNEEDSRSVEPSEMSMCSYGEESASGDESVDKSEAELDFSSSESEESDDEEDPDAVRRLKLGAMINHENLRATPLENAVSSAQAPTPTKVQSSSTVRTLPTGPDFDKFFGSAPSPFIVRPPVKESEPERLNPTDIEPMSLFNEEYGNTQWMPPRPSAPKPVSWSVPSMPQYGAGSNFMRENTAHNSWLEESQVGLFPLMPMNEYRVDSLPPFSRLNPPLNSLPEHNKPFPPSSSIMATSSNKSEAGIENRHSIEPAMANNMQTAPMPTSGDPTVSVPQQSSRTKVSIAEIVEEAPVHPPTPNSMASPPSLKRKASVLEEDEEDTAKPSSAVSSEIQGSTNETSTIAARPKKSPRLRGALRFAGTMAAGVAVGAVAVVGGLLYLPQEAFAV